METLSLEQSGGGGEGGGGGGDGEGDGDNCVQTYLFPPSCRGDSCQYMARWVRISPRMLEVEVRHRVDDGKWTAIGFSANRRMVSLPLFFMHCPIVNLY